MFESNNDDQKKANNGEEILPSLRFDVSIFSVVACVRRSGLIDISDMIIREMMKLVLI